MTKLKAKIYTQEGKQKGDIDLPDFVFGLPWNGDLVHQVVTSMSANQRAGTAWAKDRSEVSGGGRKPHRQKGTGRARHGSSRSPIWRGGGVTHGPTALKSYKKKINKKMTTKALYTVLSEKFRAGEIFFIDNIKLAEAKTQKAQEVLQSLSKINGFEKLADSKKKIVYLANYLRDENNLRSFKNLPQISFGEVRNIDPLKVLQYKYLLITNPKESIDLISKRLGKSEAPNSKSETNPKSKIIKSKTNV